MREQGFGKQSRLKYGASLSRNAISTLRRQLSEHWVYICQYSSKIASSSGIDELRCDWLVGDERFGPRLGEIQYTGSANRVPAHLQPLMAYLFVRGHTVATQRERARARERERERQKEEQLALVAVKKRI
jgi:hypothetical protein